MNIKIGKAKKLANVGRFERSWTAVIEAIPAPVIAALSSVELAILADSIWAGWNKAKAINRREILDEGAVWDARIGCMVGLAVGAECNE